MSLRANIVMINEDGSVIATYCHDGQRPRDHEYNMGAILARHYNSRKRVLALMTLGFLSSLGRELTFEQHPEFDYKLAHPDHTFAYHRDRGDAWEDSDPLEFDSWEDYQVFSDAEVVYVYDCRTNKWTWGAAPNAMCSWRAKENQKPLPAECYAAEQKQSELMA